MVTKAKDHSEFQYWCPRVQKNKKWKSSHPGNRSYQLTTASRFALGWLVCWHGLAGNSYFPRGRIFISCFSEPLDINIEILNGLLVTTFCLNLFWRGVRCPHSTNHWLKEVSDQRWGNFNGCNVYHYLETKNDAWQPGWQAGRQTGWGLTWPGGRGRVNKPFAVRLKITSYTLHVFSRYIFLLDWSVKPISQRFFSG